MQTENIKKVILIGIICSVAGFIVYDSQLHDTETQTRSRFDKNIEAIKNIDIQKGKQKNLQTNKPTMKKHMHSKPTMKKHMHSKPTMKKRFQAQVVMNDISGIGAMIIQLGDFTYIQKSLPNGPADNAGLKSGDKIISINDQNASKLSMKEIFNLIRGEAGTTVSLEIERQTGETIALDIERVKLNPLNKLSG
ncbi:MAG: PDZ domain-containing protein [Dehalococcoidia bacterium]